MCALQKGWWSKQQIAPGRVGRKSDKRKEPKVIYSARPSVSVEDAQPAEDVKDWKKDWRGLERTKKPEVHLGRPKKIKTKFVPVDSYKERKIDWRDAEQKDKEREIEEKEGDIYPAEEQSLDEKEIKSIEEVDREKEFDLDKILNIELDDEERKAIGEEICEAIKKSIEASADLYDNLEKWNDMYECIKDSSKDNDPWDDAANFRSGNVYTSVKGKTVRYMQSIFGIEPYCIIDFIGEQSNEKKDLAKRIEQWFHTLQTRIIHTDRRCKNQFKLTAKDGTGCLKLYWDRKFVKNPQIQNYQDLETFLSDFPSVEESGISQKEYNNYIENLQRGKSVNLLVMGWKEVHNVPMFDTVDRKDVVFIPAAAKSFETAVGICHRIYVNWNDLKEGEAQGLYIDIDKIKESVVGGGNGDNIDRQKDEIEGKSAELEKSLKTKPIEMFHCLYEYDVNKDGLNEKCIFTIEYKTKTLIRAKYWVNNLFFIPTYIEERPNRIDGLGVSQLIENDNDELDEIKRLRVNSAKMVCSPSFKAKKGSDFDPTAQSWYPGVVWWLQNMDDVQEWTLVANFPELYTEQQSLQREIELKTGVTSGMSGRESPTDPEAPGIKLIALLRESNTLINDDIGTLRFGLEDLFFHMIEMCSEYLDDDDKYLRAYNLTKNDLKIARENVILHGVSVTSNKEVKKQEDLQFYQIVRKEPMIDGNPQAVRYLLEDLFTNWDKDKSKLLPSEEELKEQQIQMTMEAIRRLKEQEEIQGQVNKLRARGYKDNEIKQMLSRQGQQQNIGVGGGMEEGMPEETSPEIREGELSLEPIY